MSVNRVVPISSSEFVSLAKRPSYSVLGHEKWNLVGYGGVTVAPMRDWKSALSDAMPDIIKIEKNGS